MFFSKWAIIWICTCCLLPVVWSAQLERDLQITRRNYLLQVFSLCSVWTVALNYIFINLLTTSAYNVVFYLYSDIHNHIRFRCGGWWYATPKIEKPRNSKYNLFWQGRTITDNWYYYFVLFFLLWRKNISYFKMYKNRIIDNPEKCT